MLSRLALGREVGEEAMNVKGMGARDFHALAFLVKGDPASGCEAVVVGEECAVMRKAWCAHEGVD